MKRNLKSFLSDSSGNFAIMGAIFIGTLILVGGVAIETSRMVSLKSKLQGMADSSALAGAFIAKNNIGMRDEHVRKSIMLNQNDIDDAALSTNAIVTFDDETEEVTVEIPTSFPSIFAGILGRKALNVSVKSIVSYKTEKIDPLTIAFALDVSGSMGWGTIGEGSDATGTPKIEVLRDATKILFAELEAGSPNPELLPDAIRTGMSAYNTDLVATQPVKKGWKHLESPINALAANGGTNSRPALDNAYEQIKGDRKHRTDNEADYNPADHREYVIFMTDGDNNEIIWDEESAQTCQIMRNDGVEIFSIAFASPEKGEILLLDCASWNDGQEKADDPDLEDFAELDANPEKNKCKKGKKGNGNNGNGNAFGLGNGNNGNGNGNNGNGNNGNGNGNNGNGNNGNGNAYGHCKAKEKKEEAKSEFYFDAQDAETFKESFARIGRDIADPSIRIRG